MSSLSVTGLRSIPKRLPITRILSVLSTPTTPSALPCTYANAVAFWTCTGCSSCSLPFSLLPYPNPASLSKSCFKNSCKADLPWSTSPWSSTLSSFDLYYQHPSLAFIVIHVMSCIYLCMLISFDIL